MSRDDPNFGGNPGRVNSGGWNSTTAGGYNGPGDRSGSWTGGYADPRGRATPGAGQAGRDWNANVARMGGFTPGMNFDNTTGGYVPGQIRSGPLPPARPNPANVRPAGVSTPMPGPSTPVPQFQGTMDDYNKWWGGFWNDFTNKWSGPTGGLGPAAFGSIGGTWNPVSGGPNGYVTSNTGEWNPVSRGPNGPRNRTSIY